LRPVYTATSAEAAAEELAEFSSRPWGTKYPNIAQSVNADQKLIPFVVETPK
jgi:transposase-like protein